MRVLASFPDEPSARRLAQALAADEIGTEVTQSREGPWTIWLLDEVHRARAVVALEEYQQNPDDPRFKAAPPQKEPRPRKSPRPARHRETRMRERWDTSSRGFGRLTLALIIISVAVALFTNIGNRGDLSALFLIAPVARGIGGPWFGLQEVASGELWRLLTPIFLHSGILHLIFNMMWLKELGASVERVQSTLFLALFVTATGVASNLAQYFFFGPFFGGMSGVVYALFGYAWIRGRFDARTVYYVPPHVVNVMLIWFVLCFTPLIPAANGAHAGGLISGALWGWLAAKRRTSPR